MPARTVAWLGCLAVQALACAAWAAFPTLEAAPLARVGLFATIGFAMLGMVFLFPDISGKNARRWLISAAVLLRIILWAAPVSDDVNRYLWEGRLVRDGGNPYAAPASDPRWEGRRDAQWQAMNHRDIPTLYPPGIQWTLAAATSLTSDLWIAKVLALAGDLATLILLLRLLRDHAAPLRWAGLYAFNPVVLIAFAAEGHFDSLMNAALLAALLAAARHKSVAWVWLGVAIQIKLVCLVLIPLFITRSLLRHAWILPLVLVIPSLPFLSGLTEPWHADRLVGKLGSFNAPLVSALSWLGESVSRPAALLIFGGILAIVTVARWRGMALIDACRWVLASLLVCSPVVHFWYLTWLLPLVAIRPSFAWTTLSITLGGYFIAWWTLANAGWWGFGHFVTAVIWLPWLIAGALQLRAARPQRFSHSASTTDVVIPTLNAGAVLKTLIATLQTEPGFLGKIVIADGGSTDHSNAGIDPSAHQISSPPGRGNQIAAGIAATDAPWILIAHADSIPRAGWHRDLQNAIDRHPDAALFVFGQRFDRSGPSTLFIECLNEMRVVFGGVAFGDQTMVVRRCALEAAGGFPAQPLMEDVEVSLRLARVGRIVYLGKEWTVSGGKWRVGFAARTWLVFRLVATYQLARLRGRAHAMAVSERMYRTYYQKTLRGDR